MDSATDNKSKSVGTNEASSATIDKYSRNIEILTAELTAMQDATTTMESCMRVIEYTEASEEPFDSTFVSSRPNPWSKSEAGCCIVS